MRGKFKDIWNWYWCERSGTLLLPRVRGIRRLILEIPISILCIYGWYIYFLTLPVSERDWLIAIIVNPLGVIGIICIAAHQIGIGYLRDHLPYDAHLSNRLLLCIPGRVEALYKRQYGTDLAVNVVDSIGIVALGSLSLGLLAYNSNLIFPGGRNPFLR